MKLHESPNDFKDLITATAQFMNIREVYVEKDYWVTLLLKRLSLHPDASRVIFKGGTSLSKGYGLVKRFSEDVDLALITDGLNGAQLKKLISKVSKELTLAPFLEVNDPELTSKMGMSRRTLHSYPRYVDDNNFGPVKENILLEINCFGKPTPNSNKMISSFVCDFLINNNMKNEVSNFDLESFTVLVLDYKRTFVEKILAISYASFEDGENSDKEMRARVRHFYDLTALHQEEEIKNFVLSSDFKEMMNMVREEERLSSRIKWVNHKLKECILHSQPQKTLDRVESYYESDLAPMVFKSDDLPDFRKVKSTFKVIAEILAKENI